MGQELVPHRVRMINTGERLADDLREIHRVGRLATRPETITPTRVGSRNGQTVWSVDVEILRPKLVRPKRRDSVASDLGKALLFALACVMASLTTLVAFAFALSELLTGETLAIAAGGTVLFVIVLLVGTNRLNHSGTCPGIAVHCSGCKR